MKSITLIFFVIASIHVYTQETLLVEYELQRDFDLDKISTANNTSDVKVPESLKSELKKLFTEKHSYTLLLNKTESSFDWIEKINNSQTAGIFANISMGDMGLIYKNLEKNLVEREASVANQNLIIKDTLDNLSMGYFKRNKRNIGL